MLGRWIFVVVLVLFIGVMGFAFRSVPASQASSAGQQLTAAEVPPSGHTSPSLDATNRDDDHHGHHAAPAQGAAAGAPAQAGQPVYRRGVTYSPSTISSARAGGPDDVTAAQLISVPGGIPVRLTALLTGTEEVPGPGDPDATGTAIVTLDASQGTVCTDWTIENVMTPIAAHIHIGPPGVAGPISITLPTPPLGESSDCVEDVESALIDAVIQDPGGFYVNVHTPDYPAGAMRGQLAAGNLAIASLTGAEEVPGPGDPDGSGMAVITLNGQQRMVCFDIAASDILTPTAAHIHVGPVGVAGPITVTLVPPVGGTSSGCVTDVDPATITEIEASPADFYVNVHTSDYPAGAIRGQLGAALRLSTVLTGAEEVPGPGDPDGTGSAIVWLSQSLEMVCYSLSAADILTPTAAHVHAGPPGVAGPITVTLTPPVGGIVNACTTAEPETVRAIGFDPSGYYVNVHTSDYPAGAIRGQLAQEGQSVQLRASLTGEQEVPGPGDPDGTGTAQLRLNESRGTVCYRLTALNIATPTAAHIHEGPVGVAGPIVVPLDPPVDGEVEGCATGVDPALIAAIVEDPAAYYVNVHNADYPAGAIRGQLSSDQVIHLPVILVEEIS